MKTILHVTHSIGKESFGLGQVCVSLANEQLNFGVNANIWCFDDNENVEWASNIHGFPKANIDNFSLRGPKKLYFSPDIIKTSRNKNIQKPSIVHQHGIWTGISVASSIMNRKFNIPTIIAPHGSLTKVALQGSVLKKRIALKTYERKNLYSASCIHATSESEINDIRDFGLKNPIAFIKNGIHEKYTNVSGDALRFRSNNNIPEDKRIILFLSRITPNKGLLMLLEVVNSLKNDFEDWVLIIAGNDEKNHKTEIIDKVKEFNLEDKVKFLDPIFGKDKEDIFAAADFFILPSLSEGSPMVVLDSLAYGVPVLTTMASSWQDLNTFNCGWWTEISFDSIKKSMKEAISLPKKELVKMGQNGKELIKLKYTWSQLAKETILLYDWLLESDDKPDFVIIK